MNKWLAAGLLSLGCTMFALSQNAPVDLDSLGYSTLADFELHGKVKAVRVCSLVTDYCETLEFNAYGVELQEIRNRKLVSSLDGTVVFETPTNHGRILDTYQDGLLLSREEEGGDIVPTRRVFEYSPERLPTKESLYQKEGDTFVLQGVNLLNYEGGHLASVVSADGSFTTLYNANGAKVAERSFQDGETFILEFTYDYDAQGNWIKRYEEEEPTLTREITYG
ncbi:hypothetical protein [Deinococcus cellulosilyticus]|nr:hypothetical protein [Deinococcus cellulosilyticus]